MSRVAIIIAMAVVASQAQLAMAKDPDLTSLARDFNPVETDVQQVNRFTVGPLGRHEDNVPISEASVDAKLLTPLNTKVAAAGDLVRAEVTASRTANGAPWLPIGSILEGTVEQSDKEGRCRKNGAIYVRFYYATAGSDTFELSSAPNTADSALHALPRKVTTKAKIRGALLTATFIALPFAIPSMGTALAISAGAGAVIGGVLADDHKYLQGAIAGAWQGSGLSVFNPIVQKGRSVVLPVGTTLSLNLTDETQVPRSVLIAAERQQKLQESPPAVTTETHATILSTVNPDKIIARCHTLIEQKDLASAIDVLDKALERAPECQPIKEYRDKLLSDVTARGANRTAITTTQAEVTQ